MTFVEKMASLDRFYPMIGRILLSFIFLFAGYGKIIGYSMTAGYMESAGLPLVAVLLPLTILIEIGGGLMLLIGVWPRIAANILFLFLIPVTLVFHGFWNAPPEATPMEMGNFLKNLALMGGLALVAATNPCPLLPRSRKEEPLGEVRVADKTSGVPA